MNIIDRLKVLFGMKEAYLEKTVYTLSGNDYDNTVWIQNLIDEPRVKIATTQEFNEYHAELGNFLPEEVQPFVDELMPKKATDGAAGIDLKAFLGKETVINLMPNETKLIKTGFKWQIPTGYVGMVCSRSGMALKHSVFVLNAPGIVDSDYRGDVGVILHNSGTVPFPIANGDRIAQMVIVETPELAMENVLDLELTETTRGTGGFGSTGKKD